MSKLYLVLQKTKHGWKFFGLFRGQDKAIALSKFGVCKIQEVYSDIEIEE